MDHSRRTRSAALRSAIPATVLILLAAGCASHPPEQEAPAPAPASGLSRPDLREKLLELRDRDQAARRAMIESMREAEPQAGGGVQLGPEGTQALRAVQEIDEESSAFLRATIDEVGWPGAELVGEDGAHAAWLLVQHADRQPDLQRRALELMQAQLGTGGVAPSDVALLTDRVRTASREPQLYGTQFAAGSDGVQRPLPIEDPAHVDERRAEVGLPPLAEYARQLGEVYGAPASPEPMEAFP